MNKGDVNKKARHKIGIFETEFYICVVQAQ